MADIKGAAALGVEPVGKLLRQYAVPAIVAMTASSLYNMVDSIFIGQGVGPFAISGLAITFPLMNLSAAFGALVGVGCATLLPVRLRYIFQGAGQLRDHECDIGLDIDSACLHISRRYIIFLRSERADHTVCSRLYAGDSAWQCDNTPLYGS